MNTRVLNEGLISIMWVYNRRWCAYFLLVSARSEKRVADGNAIKREFSALYAVQCNFMITKKGDTKYSVSLSDLRIPKSVDKHDLHFHRKCTSCSLENSHRTRSSCCRYCNNYTSTKYVHKSRRLRLWRLKGNSERSWKSRGDERRNLQIAKYPGRESLVFPGSRAKRAFPCSSSAKIERR